MQKLILGLFAQMECLCKQTNNMHLHIYFKLLRRQTTFGKCATIVEKKGATIFCREQY